MQVHLPKFSQVVLTSLCTHPSKAFQSTAAIMRLPPSQAWAGSQCRMFSGLELWMIFEIRSLSFVDKWSNVNANTLVNWLCWNWRWSFLGNPCWNTAHFSKSNSPRRHRLNGNVTECKWEDLWVLFLHEFVVFFAEVRNINILWPFSKTSVSITNYTECGPVLAGSLPSWCLGPDAWCRSAVFTRVS